jgi:hypothetical protein
MPDNLPELYSGPHLFVALLLRIFATGAKQPQPEIVPMALVAFEQYFPKAQGVIDDGLAPTGRRLAPTPVERMVSTQRGCDSQISTEAKPECRWKSAIAR